MNVQEIDDFLAQIPVATTTKELYRFELLSLMAWLQAERLAVETLSGREFIRFLDDHPTWGSSSRYQALAAARRFVRFVCGEEHPLLKLKVRRESAGPQRTLSLDEIRRLFAWLASLDPEKARYRHIRDLRTVTRLRNLALFSLLLDTGLRAAEVCRLELEDLDLDTRRLQVRIKGGRWGEGIFSVLTRDRLREWLAVRDRFARPGVKAFFVGIGGLTPGMKLTNNGLRIMCRRIARQAGIKRFSPHAFRRSMAVIALQNGASTRAVQLLGRWQNISMVERYSQTLTVESFERYSPVMTAAE